MRRTPAEVREQLATARRQLANAEQACTLGSAWALENQAWLDDLLLDEAAIAMTADNALLPGPAR